MTVPEGRVVMLGFDAMDPALTMRMADRGKLPAFRELFNSSARCQIKNPPGLFVGSLWSTFFTGRSAADTGFHCWEEIVPGGYERRLTTAEAIRGRPFWETLSDAGKRVAVLDVPHSCAGTPINGVQMSEWGCHDRHFGFRTYPPELAQQIIDQVGLHPVLGADPFSVREWAPDDYELRADGLRSAEEEEQLLAGLVAGAAAKRRLSVQILSEGPWDLFLSIFGEPHSVGHQSWHLHDPSHPRHDPALRQRIGDPLAQVYKEMDAALSEHLARVPDDATVLVLLSHGMGPHYDGTHLLPEILRRLDRAYRSPLERSREGRALGRVWAAMPAWSRTCARPGLAAVLRTRLRRRDLRAPADFDTDEQRRSQAFFLSPNNFVVGGVRINLRGREEVGQIRPGAELEAIYRRLEQDLLALVNVESGTTVIDRVVRSDEHYERAELDALPDLFLEWNQDHPIEVVWSPRIGMIRGPYVHWRTGDHRPGGLLLVAGPEARAGSALPPLEIQELSADIAARLGVPPTDGGAQPAPSQPVRA
jgi:predicted AlkP superfamily phosphohydrolase/phosphomutase